MIERVRGRGNSKRLDRRPTRRRNFVKFEANSFRKVEKRDILSITQLSSIGI